MKKPAASQPLTSDKGVAPAPPKLHVGREIADTTWRMTVPVVIFTFIGIFFDRTFNTIPFLTLVGMIVGFYFAVVLIKRQINRSKDS